MEFDTKTRKLTSSTGYIKSADAVYDHPIYLGIYDKPENYQEATKEEYEEYIKREEEKEDEEAGL